MNPSDFRATLKSLGLSQVGASRLFGVTDRIVRMWGVGDRPVPDLVAKVLRLVVAGKISLDDVREA